MLLAQKAYAEGGLALGLYCARLVDDERSATDPVQRQRAGRLLELLTPIAKSWPSEWCVEANSLAIQVLGGAGYTRDHPVEQYWRDNRLNMIHEGTHGIQALDLLARKVPMDGGALLQAFRAEIEATIARALAAHDPSLPDLAKDVGVAATHLAAATRMLGRIDEPNAALAHATPYMQAFGHLVLGWIWLDLAICALSSATVDTRLRASVLHTARWFIIHELPRIPAWLQPIERGDRTVHDTEEDWL